MDNKISDFQNSDIINALHSGLCDYGEVNMLKWQTNAKYAKINKWFK